MLYFLGKKCPKFGQSIRIQNDVEKFKYAIADEFGCSFMESTAFFEPCYKCLDFESFYLLLILVLKERKIIVVSEDFQKLTSTM